MPIKPKCIGSCSSLDMCQFTIEEKLPATAITTRRLRFRMVCLRQRTAFGVRYRRETPLPSAPSREASRLWGSSDDAETVATETPSSRGPSFMVPTLRGTTLTFLSVLRTKPVGSRGACSLWECEPNAISTKEYANTWLHLRNRCLRLTAGGVGFAYC